MKWLKVLDFLSKITQSKPKGFEQSLRKEEPTTKYEHQVARNLHHQKNLGWETSQLYEALEEFGDNDINDQFVEDVKRFQKLYKMTADGIMGPGTFKKVKNVIEYNKMDPLQKAYKKVYDPVFSHEARGKWGALNRDGEYRGLADKTWLSRTGEKHPASGRYHIGLSAGSLQATQDGGALGKMLKAMHERDPILFVEHMGDTYDLMLAVVTASGRSSHWLWTRRGKLVERSPRCQKISVDYKGRRVKRDLWEEPWTSRIKALLEEESMIAIQKEFFVDEYLIPILDDIKKYNLKSEKAVCACFDRSIHKGRGGFITMLEKNCRVGDTEENNVKRLLRADKSTRFEKRYNDNSLEMTDWAGWILL